MERRQNFFSFIIDLFRRSHPEKGIYRGYLMHDLLGNYCEHCGLPMETRRWDGETLAWECPRYTQGGGDWRLHSMTLTDIPVARGRGKYDSRTGKVRE